MINVIKNKAMNMLPGNPLFRLLLVNWLIGFLAAVLCFAGLIVGDVGSLRHLIFAAENPVLPSAVLGFGFLVTLTSAAMGTAIMMLPSGGDQGGRRLGLGSEVSPEAGAFEQQLVPIRIKSHSSSERF